MSHGTATVVDGESYKLCKDKRIVCGFVEIKNIQIKTGNDLNGTYEIPEDQVYLIGAKTGVIKALPDSKDRTLKSLSNCRNTMFMWFQAIVPSEDLKELRKSYKGGT